MKKISTEFAVNDLSDGLGVVSRVLEPWVLAPTLPDQATRYDWPSGASMLIRTSVFRDIGLMWVEGIQY